MVQKKIMTTSEGATTVIAAFMAATQSLVAGPRPDHRLQHRLDLHLDVHLVRVAPSPCSQFVRAARDLQREGQDNQNHNLPARRIKNNADPSIQAAEVILRF